MNLEVGTFLVLASQMRKLEKARELRKLAPYHIASRL